MTLASCDSLYACEGCYSEDSFCYRSCGDTVEGEMGENLLSLVSNVNSTTECKLLCAATQNCSFFTFYDENHAGFSSTCFLLQHLKTPFKPCENCYTSPTDCLGYSLCAFLNEENSPIPGSQIFTNESQTSTLHTIRLGECSSSLKILAIGGGGGYACDYGEIGSDHYSYCSGGGSGYLNYTAIEINNSVKISLSVGSGGEPSQVVLGEDGAVAALGVRVGLLVKVEMVTLEVEEEDVFTLKTT